MKNIKTMQAFSSALLIFGCFITVLILGVYFLSEDKDELEIINAQHIVYQSIGELAGFSITSNTTKTESSIAKTVNVLNDNKNNPGIEKIVNCYTNNSALVFRDYLRAVNFSMGQFCKVQQNLETTSTSNQNNSNRCSKPKSVILSLDELKKLGRQYTGDIVTDLASCKI